MSSEISKDNFNKILADLGKEYRRRGGKSIKAEIVMTGGAAVIAKDGFRNKSHDVDAMNHTENDQPLINTKKVKNYWHSYTRNKVIAISKRINIMKNWREFNPLAVRSMKDDFNEYPSAFRKEILAYLNNGEVILASPSSAIDFFTGERINQTNCIMTDGEYSWSNSLAYYVEKYNLQIPKEFEDRIKEALTNTGAKHQEMNGSLSDGGASLCHSNI